MTWLQETLDVRWQTLSLWRRPRISQKPNVCALGRAGTYDAQTIKKAKQHELSQLESAEEGSGCPRGLRFSQQCEQLEGKAAVCLWVHIHVCISTSYGKVKLFSRTSCKLRRSADGISQSCLIKIVTLGLLFFAFLLSFPPHPSLAHAHAPKQLVRRRGVRRFLQTSSPRGSGTMRHVHAQQPNTIQNPCLPTSPPL